LSIPCLVARLSSPGAMRCALTLFHSFSCKQEHKQRVLATCDKGRHA
jgi:hypothetical protein